MSNSDLKRRGKEVERQGTNKTNCKFWLLDDLVGVSDDFRVTGSGKLGFRQA